MCGLVGFFATDSGSLGNLENIVARMSLRIQHRGPDDAGTWADAHVGIALGHRRLSILDLSSAGHQPMASVCGRYVIAFNGEIYNHLKLRSLLCSSGNGWEWRGHSDTETLLACLVAWGIEKTLASAVGMFAMALWDRETRTLTLARDRFGEKPLYYGWVGAGEKAAFVFGSELKGLKAYPGFSARVCRQALVQYLRFMYVPAPRTIYEDIFKLEPGCLLTVHGQPPLNAPPKPLRPGQAHGTLQLQRWWSLADAVEVGAENPVTDEAEALHLLEAQLSESVSIQSLADVPLGAFLSGGVDSSTIVALMQHQSSRPVKTFTIGFDEAGFDESPHALAVARHLGTEHHEVRVSARMAQDVIPTLTEMYDEPFSDSSQIPTYLVCQAARQHVTVALSGDGGDELFGGYNRYTWGPRLWSKVGNFPYYMRRALGGALSFLPTSGWDVLAKPFDIVHPGEKLHKLSWALHDTRSFDDVYLNLVSEWHDCDALVSPGNGTLLGKAASLLDDPLPKICVEQQALRMMYRDAMTYLPDDILCKVDRAAMANSLETRVPFLDHRVAELAWRLPLHMKVRGNVGKWALRQVLYKHVPRALIERPKVGFAVPLGQWLRGPLKAWAEELIAADRLQREGYFDSNIILKTWKEHLSCRYDHAAKIWSILMFQAWLEMEVKNKLVAQ